MSVVRLVVIFALSSYPSSVNGVCLASVDGVEAVQKTVTFGRNVTLSCEIPEECIRGVWRKRDRDRRYEDILEGTCGKYASNGNICHRIRDGRNVLDIYDFRQEDTGCFECQCDNHANYMPAKTVVKFNIIGVCWMTVAVNDAITEFNNSLGRSPELQSLTVEEGDYVAVECQAWAAMETNCTDNQDSPLIRIRAGPEHDFCKVRCVSREDTYSYSDCDIDMMLRVNMIRTTSPTIPTTLSETSNPGIVMTTKESGYIPRESPATDAVLKPEVYPDTSPDRSGNHVATLVPLITLVLFLLTIVIGLCCYLYSPIFNAGAQKSFREQATSMAYWNGAVGRHNRISAREILKALEGDEAFDIELSDLPFSDVTPTAGTPVSNSCTYGIRLDEDSSKGGDGAANTCGNNNMAHPMCEDDYCSMHSFYGANVGYMPLQKRSEPRESVRNHLQRSYSENGPRDRVIQHHFVDSEMNHLTASPPGLGSKGAGTGFKIIRRSYPVTGGPGNIIYYKVIEHGANTKAKSAQSSPEEETPQGLHLPEQRNTCANGANNFDVTGSDEMVKKDEGNTYYHVFDDSKDILPKTTQKSPMKNVPLPTPDASKSPELPQRRRRTQMSDKLEKRGSTSAETDYNLVGRSESEGMGDCDAATPSDYATVIRCDQPSHSGANVGEGVGGIDQELEPGYDDVAVPESEPSTTADSDIYASIMQQ